MKNLSADATRDERQEINLTKTLRMMLILRVVIVTALLGAALYVQVFFGITSDSFYFIIGLTYLLTLFYAVLTPPLKESRTFIFTQLVIDEMLVSILVLVTGGMDSAFVILYYVPVVTAALTLGRVSSLLIAVLASVMFSVVSIAANGGVFDLSILFPYVQPAINTLIYTIVLHVSALMIIASISGYLSGILQSTAASLRERTKALLRLQVLNESIIKSITSGIITTDMNGMISFLNPAAQELFGIPQNKIVGHNIYDFVSFNPSAPYAIISGDRWSREMLLLGPDAVSIEVSISRSYLLGTGTDQGGKLYVIQDLREINDLRQRLRLKDRLTTAGEMSAAIAHEIRNPLGAISGSAQMIRKSQDLEEDQLYLMDIIVRESERLSSTLNEFLTFTRQPVFSPNKINLVNVAKETIDLLVNSPQLRDKHQVRFQCDRSQSLLGEVDPNMFKQLIYNLVLNGVRAMPEGGILDVELKENSKAALLKVVDCGVGVPADRLEKMFQPFASGSVGGIGLGLAIVYRIVQEHGGVIQVRSKLGTGTSMTISLPLKRGNREDFSVKVETAEP